MHGVYLEANLICNRPSTCCLCSHGSENVIVLPLLLHVSWGNFEKQYTTLWSKVTLICFTLGRKVTPLCTPVTMLITILPLMHKSIQAKLELHAKVA